MPVSKILRHAAIGETLSLALDGDEPVGLLVEPWENADDPWMGQHLTVRLRARSNNGRSAFLETESGETVFMERGPPRNVPIGATVSATVKSEARRGKSATVIPARQTGDPPIDRFRAWAAGLRGADAATIETAVHPALLHEAIDQALSPSVLLPGGGRLTLSRTPALTAVDIDTAGRADKGSAGVRAATINRIAAETLAKQLSLRGLGGLVVLDCIAPIPEPNRRAIRDAFLSSFRQCSSRKAEALTPSPFGLVECALAWGQRPIDEFYLDPSGQPLPRALLVSGLRDLERAARSAPATRLALALPEPAYGLYANQEQAYSTALAQRYGARFIVRSTTRPRPEISHAD